MIPMTDKEALFWILGFVAGKIEMTADDVNALRSFLKEHLEPRKDSTSTFVMPGLQDSNLKHTQGFVYQPPQF